MSKIFALALVAALSVTGFVAVQAQSTPNTTLSINKQVRNLTANQTSYFESVGAVPGDNVEFRIQVQNTGSFQANNVVINDTLPNNFNLGSGFTNTNLGILAVGASTTITLTARVGDASNFPFGLSTWTSLANVTASNLVAGSTPVNDMATVVVNRSAEPNVSVNMEVRNLTTGTGFTKLVSAQANDKLQFRITVSNSNGTAANLRVIDNLPTDLRYVYNTLRIDGVGSTSGDLFNSHVLLGDLTAGSSRTVTYDATVDVYAQVGTVLTNSASAFSNNDPLKSDGVQVSISNIAGSSIDLVLSHSASVSTAKPNDLVIYTLTVQNRGNAGSSQTIEIDLTDVLKLSNLVDFNGAEFVLSNYKLRWTNVSVPANVSVQKIFSVRVHDTIDSDRVMTSVFGNTVNVSLPTVAGASTMNTGKPKVAGKFVAPKTGMPITLSLTLSTLTLVGFIILRRKRLAIQAK